MSKAILLVRVSTDRQDFDEQERELYEMALKDGYTDDNIIPICEKESGVKLKEEERNGLNHLKRLIAEGGINTVYAWEVSRIARKKKVLFSVVDYLVENRVQLIIKEPYLKLLNPDKTVNDGAETILTLYAQLAEAEMRSKKVRWHRTHVKNSKSGKWNGGHPVRFGYKLDENNYYVIDEAQAEIVRKAFEIYTTTNSGTTAVTRELIKLGYNVTYHQVARILTGEHYTGKLLNSQFYVKNDTNTGWEKVQGLQLRYPAIISQETYDEAKRRRAINNSIAYKRDSYYFGRGLMRCPSCGTIMSASNANGWYCCANHQMSNHNIDNRCLNNTTVGINVCDTILWDATVSEYINANKQSLQDKIEVAQKKIKECQQIINAAADRLAKTETRRMRYTILYGDGEIDDETYIQRKAQITKERAEIEQDRISAQEKIDQCVKVIETKDGGSMIDQLNSLSEEAFGVSELCDMCELVHTYIERVEVAQDAKRYKFITVYAFSGAVYKYRVRYAQRQHRYWRVADEIMMQSMSPWVEFTPNIIIKRKTGHLRKDETMTQPFIIIRNVEMNYNIQNEVNATRDKAKGVEFLKKFSEKLK